MNEFSPEWYAFCDEVYAAIDSLDGAGDAYRILEALKPKARDRSFGEMMMAIGFI